MSKQIKNQIKGKLISCLISQPNTTASSRIFCTKIELIDNHLMFYYQKQLIFKVWLKKTNIKNVNSALKSVKIKLVKPIKNEKNK